MKRYLVAALAGLLLVGCTARTEFGPCVGLNDKENPALEYKYSAWNIAIGLLFFEFLVPPIDVALNKLKCPEGRR